MFKFTALALLAGLVTATTIVPSSAQFLVARVPGGNTPSSSSDNDCAYPLNAMPRVSRTLIDSIQGRPVYLIPVCEDGLIGRNDDYGWLFAWGNVGTLREPIARNATLMAALTDQGYDHQDVVSLRVGGDDSIILYVHQRNLR